MGLITVDNGERGGEGFTCRGVVGKLAYTEASRLDVGVNLTHLAGIAMWQEKGA
jgi:hypothetical protein